MPIHPLAGKPAPKDILVDLDALKTGYYGTKPDVSDPNQLVSFGVGREQAQAETILDRAMTAITSREPSPVHATSRTG